MESITINIVNPKAKKLIKELEALELISIRKEDGLKSILNYLRKKSETAPTLEEITREVEKVRSKRYARK